MVIVDATGSELFIKEKDSEGYHDISDIYYCAEGYSIIKKNPNFFIGNVSLSVLYSIFHSKPESIILSNKEEEDLFFEKHKDDYLLLYSINRYINKSDKLVTEIRYNIIDNKVNNELGMYVRKLIIDKTLITL